MRQLLYRIAGRPEDALMQGVAKALDRHLANIGKSAVREIVTVANRISVDPVGLPYVFWALATKTGLPSFTTKGQQAFNLMIDIMERTDVMPNYDSAFAVPEDLAVDSAVDVIAKHMAVWSLRVMYPALLQVYQGSLNAHANAVPKATGGQVSPENAVEFLRRSFRQVLSLSSRKFRDGELLRRVVRILPI